jgi:hypothetical protein
MEFNSNCTSTLLIATAEENIYDKNKLYSLCCINGKEVNKCIKEKLLQ